MVRYFFVVLIDMIYFFLLTLVPVFTLLDGYYLVGWNAWNEITTFFLRPLLLDLLVFLGCLF